jgi:hypothetical protein
MEDGYVVLTSKQARALLISCSAGSSVEGDAALEDIAKQLAKLGDEGCPSDFVPFVESFEALAGEHIETLSGKASLISLQGLAIKISSGAARSIGGISEAAALIARNPDLLRGDYNPGEESGNLYEGVAEAFSEAVGADLFTRAERLFIDQFPAGFKPVQNFRKVAERLVDSWLESQKKVPTAPASAKCFKEMLGGLTNDQNSVVWHLESLMRTHAKLRKAFGSEYALAKDALGIVDSFRERDRLAKSAA